MSTQPFDTSPPPPQTGTPNTSGLAIVGLVLAFLAPLVGLVLSLVALGRTGPGKGGGRGLAVAGAIVGGVLTFVGVGLIIVFAVAADDGIDREVRVDAESSADEAGVAEPAAAASVDTDTDSSADSAAEAGQAEELPASDAFVDVTPEDWGALVRDPSSRVGDLVRFYAEVTQFDVNTGADLLRANAGPTQPTGGFELPDNVILAADESVLAGAVAGDVLRVEAQVQDPVEYDTLIGGSTTAPVFTVARLENVGFLDLTPDVALGGYAVDEFGGGTLAVTITNSGAVPNSYSVDIVAVSPDGATQYDTSFVSADNLAPGQSATVEAFFFDDLPADAVFQVASVDRYDF